MTVAAEWQQRPEIIAEMREELMALVALDVEHLEFDPARGLSVLIAGSKTDQERAGARVAVPYARARDRCAIRALRA